ncbi:MAG TPA: hypothetical protein VK587_04020 [bacterium]|nr:hypothetical protein [bacterium]
MQRFVCSECGIEAEIAPRYGDEVVSAYCLKHTAGFDQHASPVLMTEIPVMVPAAAAPAVELEPEPVPA